jgi:hypothetical protein
LLTVGTDELSAGNEVSRVESIGAITLTGTKVSDDVEERF